MPTVEEQVGGTYIPPAVPPKPWLAGWEPDPDVLAAWIAYIRKQDQYDVDEDGQVTERTGPAQPEERQPLEPTVDALEPLGGDGTDQDGTR